MGDVVGAIERSVNLLVGAKDVVIGNDVFVPKILGRFRIGPNGTHIGTDFMLGEHHTDLHVVSLPLEPMSRHPGNVEASKGEP